MYDFGFTDYDYSISRIKARMFLSKDFLLLVLLAFLAAAPLAWWGTLQFIENKWTALAPHRPFSYHFLDEEYDKMYRTEIQTARLVSTFSGLAIFLACLGLFGLATYNIVQRTKEIGIRKVLGASVAGIVGLLSKDFVRLVAVALLLAAPVAWLLLNQWLADFSYRIELQWWVFAAAGAIAVGIAFLTVSVQSVRAALNNPAESLRSE